jgi:hypothetical protein
MRKPVPLVCQHLENISRDALNKYQGTLGAGKVSMPCTGKASSTMSVSRAIFDGP